MYKTTGTSLDLHEIPYKKGDLVMIKRNGSGYAVNRKKFVKLFTKGYALHVGSFLSSSTVIYNNCILWNGDIVNVRNLELLQRM